jgi:hypothetical protein
MSLHLCYRLSLPGATSSDDVRRVVQSLKDHADTLGFENVLGPSAYTADELIELDDRDVVKIMTSTLSADPPDFYGIREGEACAFAFVVVPGGECDPAVFGFLAPGARSDLGGSDDDLSPGEWFWSGACNTYYASRDSHEHFVHCHQGLVRLLDHARTLGIGVQVEDEAGFWDHRSVEKVLKLVSDLGRLEDQMAEEGAFRWEENRRIGHPDYEDAADFHAVEDLFDD